MSDAEQQPDTLSEPPAEIVVDVQNDDNEIVQLTKKEVREIRETISRLVGIVDSLTTRFKQLATASNQFADAFNSLHDNERLINAVCARVIAISEGTQERFDNALAKQIADAFIEPVEFGVRPETAEEAENIYECIFTFDDKGEAERMYSNKFDPELGQWIQVDPSDAKDGLVMAGIVDYMHDNEITPSREPMYYKYTGSTVSQDDASFNNFMDNAMNAQSVVGDVQSSVRVSQVFSPGSVKFTFTEASESDETPFSYSCWECVDDDQLGENWKHLDIDINLAMYYTSAVQAAGGASGQEWYIQIQ